MADETKLVEPVRLSSLNGFFCSLQLWLNGNRLSGALPEAARDSFNLNMLILEDNALTGRIPLSWTEFSNLSVLRVGGNRGLKPHREVELVLGKKWKTFDNAAQV